MSYLNGPRINFWGGGSTNVDTANNSGGGIVDLVTARVIADKTDEQLIAELRAPGTSNGQNYYSNAGWNYYGDHQVAFMNARVSSSGQPGVVSSSGELVGQPVYLLGSVDPRSGDGPYGGPVMVDLDPTSSQTTRIYVGGLQIGQDTPKLLIRQDTLCHSRFLGARYDSSTTRPPYATPGSVYGSGTFQVAFRKDAIVSYDRSESILRDVIEAPDAIGIVMRFSMFEFMPGRSTDYMQKNYAENRNDSNPSLGRIIGSIGPWFEGEPATCPPGRLLLNQNLGAQGLAFLDSTQGRLTLDLVSALQGLRIRQDGQANTGPIGPNVDYGDLQVGTGAAGVLKTTPSLPESYYVMGGLYDVELDAKSVTALQQAPIEITSTKNGLSITEAPYRVYSDQRNIYLDDSSTALPIELIVEHLGGAVPAETTLTLSTGESGELEDPEFLTHPASVTVPAGERHVSFSVRDNGGDPGFLALNVVFSPEPSPHPSPDYFINFRKYPADDFSAEVAAGELSWDFVYEHCLRFYYVLFPGMSKRIPLNDEATIRAVGGEILRRTSDQYRDTTLYMPLTRSLSKGAIALLRAYLEPNSANA